MAARVKNTQLFALAKTPPEVIYLRGRGYLLEKVFKHDFFAATTLYRNSDAADDKIVVKFCRTQGFCGLDMNWMGMVLFNHERKIHQKLDGINCVQKWLGPVDNCRWAFALRYIEGTTLDKFSQPLQVEFFQRLEALIGKIHRCGVAYGDMNKRSNVVVTTDEAGNQQPALIDFQVSTYLGSDSPFLKHLLFGAIFCKIQQADFYHITKHRRRLLPESMTADQIAASRRPMLVVRLLRSFYNPIKFLRRRFLNGLHAKGQLTSPTARLEDTDPHTTGETTCWRKTGQKQPVIHKTMPIFGENPEMKQRTIRTLSIGPK